MEIKNIEVKKAQIKECNLDYLIENILKISYTGFYIPNGQTNKYIFKIRDDDAFYYVKSSNYDNLGNVLMAERNKLGVISEGRMKIVGQSLPFFPDKCALHLTDLMNLYKISGIIKVDECFKVSERPDNFANQEDFYNLVKNVLMLEKEIKDKGIDLNNKYCVIKFIYDKFKMESYYWDPISNYGGLNNAYKYSNDPNKVLRHGFDFLGLICGKYATCQGMADGLVQLFNYFGISAVISFNDIHSVCKVDLNDGHHTYIDLSCEVTDNFKDSKYDYKNGTPVRCFSKRRARRDSYDFFMKRNAGFGMPDYNDNSVDYIPRINNNQATNRFKIIKRDNPQTNRFKIIKRNNPQEESGKHRR